MKLTIDRATWHRGSGQTTPFISADGSTRCALGCYLAALGVSDDALRSSILPCAVAEDPRVAWMLELVPRPYTGELVPMVTTLACEIVRVSDRWGEYAEISDAHAEERLIELFAKADVELDFVGVAPS